ncbi:MAG: sensor histidine kinase [Pseudomonadota bacterium]
MSHVRLSSFIQQNLEPILKAWEDFARTIEPPALTMDDVELRDHARQMLQVIAEDLALPQTDHEREQKSKGLAAPEREDTAAESHAEARLLSGYTVVQLVSEYRALRSSVLTLWAARPEQVSITDLADVTRFNEAVDQSLAESVARYEQMVKQSQNMFLAILGHDLRNPLGTVSTATSFLMQAVDIPAKYVLVATKMFNSTQRMSRLINDLIDFTRTHLGPGIPVKLREANLSRVCRDVVDEMRTFHPEQLIELVMPPRLDAMFDESRIAQVLSNLIGNAVQYGDTGKQVVVTLREEGPAAVITVNNRGQTIAANEMAAIFDPFVRIASNPGQGVIERTSLGIGLFIARQIAHSHHGDLQVVSTDHDGTTFTLTMPHLPGPATE